MKDLSFILLKNSLGAKMKKGIRNFCNGDASTSTLNQHNKYSAAAAAAATCPLPNLNLDEINSAEKSSSSSGAAPTPTLEEMILKLEMEEENARRAKTIKNCKGGRMSCVNNNIISNSSDILLSARNALNQYPRFSLDGKDAMYRSSFRNSDHDHLIKPGRKSVCCDYGRRYVNNNIRSSGSRLLMQQHHPNDHHDYNLEYSSSSSRSTTLAGDQRVEWCKPGVVAKLMGLDAMPVPVPLKLNTKEKLSSIFKKHDLVRRRPQSHQIHTATATDHHTHTTGWPSTHPHFV